MWTRSIVQWKRCFRMATKEQKRDFITFNDWTKEEMEQLIGKAIALKKSGYAAGNGKKPFEGKILAMVFFNSSLRTRTSLQAGMHKLGGTALDLAIRQGVWAHEHRENAVMDGKAAEHIKDAAKVLSRYCDAIGVRKFPEMKDWQEDRKDGVVRGFAKYADVPVINLESGMEHPCQALADLMTMKEALGSLKGKKVLLTWTYHPKALPMAVPNSVALAAGKMGMDLTIACPKGFELDDAIMKTVQKSCSLNKAKLEVVHGQEKAYKGADVVYAKSWGWLLHYGDPEAEAKAKQGLKHWIVDMAKMKKSNNARFMHCLPMRRNVEATDEVVDSGNSVIYRQAENRMHAQNSLLMELMGK